MKGDKKGQLTLLIIIALVLVGFIVFYFYMSDNFASEASYDQKVVVLRDTTLDCFEQMYIDSVGFISLQGGYYDVVDPKNAIAASFFAFEVPYYYFEGAVNVPSVQTVENEAEKMIDDLIGSCFEEAKGTAGFDTIDFDYVGSSVIIEEEEIIFTTNAVMSVNYDNKSVDVELINYPKRIRSKMTTMLELSNFIVNYLRDNNEWMPYSDIISLSQENDLYVNIVDDSDGLGSSIEIGNYEINSIPDIFYFSNKYSGDGLEEIAPLL